MRYPFCCCVIPTNIPRKPFCDWWRMFNTFPPICAVSFHTAHVHNRTRESNTGGFIPIASLCGAVGSPSCFIKCLIGKTVNIWRVVYINGKYIYLSKTRVCSIIECVIFHDVRHVTSTWAWISWWYDAAKVSRNPRTENLSWNSLEVNCLPASVWICSKEFQERFSVRGLRLL